MQDNEIEHKSEKGLLIVLLIGGGIEAIIGHVVSVQILIDGGSALVAGSMIMWLVLLIMEEVQK